MDELDRQVTLIKAMVAVLETVCVTAAFCSLLGLAGHTNIDQVRSTEVRPA